MSTDWGLADAKDLQGRQVAAAKARESDEYGIVGRGIRRYEERIGELGRADIKQTGLKEFSMDKMIEHLILLVPTVR